MSLESEAFHWWVMGVFNSTNFCASDDFSSKIYLRFGDRSTVRDNKKSWQDFIKTCDECFIRLRYFFKNSLYISPTTSSNNAKSHWRRAWSLERFSENMQSSHLSSFVVNESLIWINYFNDKWQHFDSIVQQSSRWLIDSLSMIATRWRVAAAFSHPHANECKSSEYRFPR